MTVYILNQDDRIGSLNRLSASFGFAQLGEEVQHFADADMDDLPLQQGDMVVGGIGYARRAFEKLGLDVPHLDPIPPSLQGFAGRRLWSSSLGEVRQRVNAGEAIFVKPAPDQPKRFTGSVLSTFRDLIPTAHLDDALIVDCAEPVHFMAEYRCFVLHGDVLGVRPYTGDPLMFPDPEVIKAAIAAFSPSPASYTLDIGVTDNGRTLLVEINDAYACGSYGLHPVDYARFIAARWAELWQSHSDRT